MLGPVLLVIGLTRIEASTASLLLNLEAVFTALLALVVLKENADRRIVLSMLLIVASGAVLAWPAHGGEARDWIGLLAIAAACLCWGIDNNLTRRVSASDAISIARTKDLVAGMVNITLAFALGAAVPAWTAAGATMAVGFIG